MERRLIGEQVEFSYLWGERWWLMNSQPHRSDGGPAYESGYCEWYEHGKFVRDNYETSADWRAG